MCAVLNVINVYAKFLNFNIIIFNIQLKYKAYIKYKAW